MYDVSHFGISALKSHEKGKKRQEIENNLSSGKQLTMHSFSKPRPSVDNTIGLQPCSSTLKDVVSMPGTSNSNSCNVSQPPTGVSEVVSTGPKLVLSFLLSDSVTKYEILWSAYCVASHTSTRCGGTAINLFPLMFPDSSIASKLRMQKDKIACSVTYGLCPYFSKLEC